MAGFLAPLSRLLDVYHYSIPMLIYGICPLIAGGLCWLLPETFNVQLQEHTTELKKPVNESTWNRHSAEEITQELEFEIKL